MSSLFGACKKNNATAARRILQKSKGAINKRDFHGVSAANWCAVFDCPDCLDVLGEFGADLNQADNDGVTPVSGAAGNGNERCAEILLKYGVDCNRPNKAGNTPLHFATHRGSEGCLRILVEYGADVSARDAAGRTPLEAAWWHRDSKEAVQYLKGVHDDRITRPRQVVMMIASRMAKVSVTGGDSDAQLGYFTTLNYDVMEMIARCIRD